MMLSSICLNCSKEFKYCNRQQKGKVCSNKCQMEWQYKEYIKRWKEGKEDGIVSKIDISGHIRRYFFEKYKASCSKCGWNKESIYTGKCPLHLNHIDGDSSNNKEDNLELLCPNCHSLTSNFGILNKGNGRYNRLNIKHPKYR